MLHRYRLLFVFLLSAFILGCIPDHDIDDIEDYSIENIISQRVNESRYRTPITSNGILSRKADVIVVPEDTMKILSIGNSYGEDALTYLPNLLAAYHEERVILGRLCCLGIGFYSHYSNLLNDTPDYTFRLSKKGKGWELCENVVTISQALSSDEWNIVILQDGGGYISFINNLVYDNAYRFVSTVLPNLGSTVSFYWHLTWTYSRDYKGAAFEHYNYNTEIMYDYVSQVDSTLNSLGYGVIPCYETFNRLRETDLNNPPLDFTRDGYHADYGGGRYAASCTWYETLIYPFNKKSVVGNSFRLKAGKINVDDKAAGIIQEVAHQVYKSREESVD